VAVQSGPSSDWGEAAGVDILSTGANLSDVLAKAGSHELLVLIPGRRAGTAHIRNAVDSYECFMHNNE